MSAPTKAAADRAGYRRALRDVQAEVDRLVTAMSLVARYAQPDEAKARLVRDVLGEVNSAVLWPLRKRAGKE